MKLTTEKFKVYSKETIYQILLPAIEKIKEKYSYANIDEIAYRKIALSQIEEIKKHIDELQNDKIDIIFMQKVNEYIKRYIKKQFNTTKKFLEITTNYINLNIKEKDNYKDTLNELKKILLYFKDLNFLPIPDLYTELLTIPTIEKMIKIVVEENLSHIKEKGIDEVFKDDILISFVETYCMLNDIKVNESEEDLNNSTYESLLAESEYTSDSVKAYLREINKPLLSAEEERKLAYRVLEGDSKAKNILIERNLKLVVSMAKKYIGKGLAFMDLIQEGNLGLMNAVDKFDVTKGYRFSTYAFHWIKQSIQKALSNKTRNIRIPVNVTILLSKYKKVQSQLQKDLGREPTIEEIANELDLSIEETAKLHKLQFDTVSINRLIGDDKDSELEKFIPSSEQTPEEKIMAKSLQTKVRELFKKCKLSDQEIKILELRNGFNESNPQTLVEIGQKFGLTRERVRQIEAKAIRKIREFSDIEELAVYMDSPEHAVKNIEEYRKLYKHKENKRKKLKLPESYKKEIVPSKSAIDISHIEIKKETEKKSEEKEKVGREVQTIYELFKDYSKEEIDETISRLSNDDQRLIRLRYGDDLENPVTDEAFGEKEKINFYSNLVRKIKRRLSNLGDKKKLARKGKTIYELLKDYSKEEIDKIISKLSNNDKRLIRLRYGDDLENPVIDEAFGEKEKTKFYSNLIPKMKRRLSKLEEKNQGHKQSEEKTKTIVPNEENSNAKGTIEVSLNKDVKLKPSTCSTETTPHVNEVDKEDYIKILGLMKSPNFDEMLKVLTPKEAVIVCLKLGYIDGKYFTTESVAGFLGIDEEEVREITKKVLMVYKDKINKFIDSAIEIVTDSSLTLKKTLDN